MRIRLSYIALIVLLAVAVSHSAYAQKNVITISGGSVQHGDSVYIANQLKDSLSVKSAADSLNRVSGAAEGADSLKRKKVKLTVAERDSLGILQPQSPIFRDSMGLSKVAAISFVVPGFSQLYNGQYWKIPVLYGVTGGLTYLTVKSTKKYKDYKSQYDVLRLDPNATRADIDPVQTKMIRYNTQRTLFMAGAILSYLYFIGDGALNHPNYTTDVKKATTLAMIFPGAGQIYNKSYWKVPIVWGAFATMGYIIDFNSRGYNRFKRAFDEYPNDEFNGYYPQNTFKNLRDQYRRNRDLSIILTGLLYVVTIVEAHVDAYLKDFEVNENIAMTVEPTFIDMSSYYAKNNYGFPGVGLALRLNF